MERNYPENSYGFYKEVLELVKEPKDFSKLTEEQLGFILLDIFEEKEALEIELNHYLFSVLHCIVKLNDPDITNKEIELYMDKYITDCVLLEVQCEMHEDLRKLAEDNITNFYNQLLVHFGKEPVETCSYELDELFCIGSIYIPRGIYNRIFIKEEN